MIRAASNRAVLAAIPRGLRRRFSSAAAGDLDATLELRIAGRRFAVRVADGQCAVKPGAAPEAGAYVAISPGDIARLVTGTVPWPKLLATGRLELGGDPFLALRFPALFGFTAPR